MELAVVVPLGALLGLALRQLLPRRRELGLLVLPTAGLLAASIAWVGLTWLGLGSGASGELAWIAWPVTVLLAIAVPLGLGLLLGARRTAVDARLLQEAGAR